VKIGIWNATQIEALANPSARSSDDTPIEETEAAGLFTLLSSAARRIVPNGTTRHDDTHRAVSRRLRDDQARSCRAGSRRRLPPRGGRSRTPAEGPRPPTSVPRARGLVVFGQRDLSTRGPPSHPQRKCPPPRTRTRSVRSIPTCCSPLTTDASPPSGVLGVPLSFSLSLCPFGHPSIVVRDRRGTAA